MHEMLMAGVPGVTRNFTMKVRWTGLVVLLAIGLIIPISSVATDADIKRKYGLDKRVIEFSKKCRQVMNQRAVSNPNVSGVQGCACMAQRLKPMPDAQLDMARKMTQIIMRAMLAQSSAADLHEQLQTLRRSHANSRNIFSQTLTVVHRALRYCGDPNNHPG